MLKLTVISISSDRPLSQLTAIIIRASNVVFQCFNFIFFLLLGLGSLSLAVSLGFIYYPFFHMKLLGRGSLTYKIGIFGLILSFIYIQGYTWITASVVPNSWVLTFQTLGLSYILFRQIDLMLQVQSKIVEKISFLDYTNFVMAFWTFLAGSIQRYKEFKEQFESPEIPTDSSGGVHDGKCCACCRIGKTV